jgi:NTE family protein
MPSDDPSHPQPPAGLDNLAHLVGDDHLDSARHATDVKSIPETGFGLCLSGGGYRAMLFHLGTFWRLNDLGILPKFTRISSVSGGSITSAFLGICWNRLQWRNGSAENFQTTVVEPICRLADRTIDGRSVGLGLLLPGRSIGEQVAKAYAKFLFGEHTLEDLPDDMAGHPTFLINATNVQSGALFRFSRRYLADYRVGGVENPDISLAVAVAASSAFPPVLSPMRLKLEPGAMQPLPGADLHREPFTTNILLTDGGVYDNLGLETVWKRCAKVIVSDGGGQMEADESPAINWAEHSLRINGLIDNQVRALRKRQVVDSFISGQRQGAYFRMRSDIADFNAPQILPCPSQRTYELAVTPTRLKKLPREYQNRIINWGYALCDAAIRTWVDPNMPPPRDFPLPGGV